MKYICILYIHFKLKTTHSNFDLDTLHRLKLVLPPNTS